MENELKNALELVLAQSELQAFIQVYTDLLDTL
jgi:hypothetical protein